MKTKNNNNINLASSFKRNSLIAVTTTAFLISIMISYIEFKIFSNRAEQIDSEYISSKKTLIKQEVLRVTDYIQQRQIQTQQNIEARIKERTYEAHAIATNIYNQFNGELPDSKIKKLIIEALRPLRFFNDKGYFFIHSLDGVLQLHPINHKNEGVNRLNYKTSTGQYVVKDLLSIINKSGEGFLHYKYPSTNNAKIEKNKFTHVKIFKPYNWSIGTGNYLENIKQDMQKEIINYIERIKFGENSYIFVVDYDGNIVMNASQKHLIGKNMSKLTDPNGVNVFLEERKAAENPNGDFIYYVWNKPSSSSPAPKMTFIKSIPEWKWMIGTGLYIDDAKKTIASQRDNLKKELFLKLLYILLLVLLISVFIINFSSRFTKLFSKEVEIFSSFFSGISREAEKIDLELLRFSEFKELAESANKMLDEKVEAEQSLLASERNLSAAQRITHFGSWELDIKNNNLHWSDEVYRIFDLSPQEQHPSYELFLSYIHPDDKHYVDEEYHLAIKNKTPYDIEHRISLKDGRVKHVREHAETTYSNEGKAINTSGTIQDITELKEKEEQLRRTLKMDALGKLTGGIAHDYNNMMGIVLGYSELLLSCVAGNQKAINYVVQIRTAGERAKSLTDKLMSFSRHKHSEKEAVDINQHLQNQQHLLEKTLTSRIKLQLDLEDNLWITKLDSGDFSDAIINMSINTLHAIETNGTMTISTHNVNLNAYEAKILELPLGDYVSIIIKDTGIGMDAQTLSKIFDPFFSTKGEMGTGLGLSQVYGFIKRSGGSINVTSELDHGTEFVMYFPRLIEKTTERKSKIEEQNLVKKQRDETILVVDDEKPLCELASELLTEYGYKVIKAYSAQEALEVLKTKKVDIVFSDIIMPEMTGDELAVQIAEKYPEIIVLLTSGFNDTKNLSIDIEEKDILTKPYSKANLLKQIQKSIDKDKL